MQFGASGVLRWISGEATRSGSSPQVSLSLNFVRRGRGPTAEARRAGGRPKPRVGVEAKVAELWVNANSSESWLKADTERAGFKAEAELVTQRWTGG